ncbi:MAG: phosphoadenylyl-sulfate reductase [Chloroflexota bacterium]
MDYATEHDIQTLQQDFDTAHPQEVLRWAVEKYADRLIVVTSFQITGIVTLHMLRQITDNVQVATLDTGLLFPETYQLIDDLEQTLDISVQRIKPELTLPQQAREHGNLLWETTPDKCCHLRKTIPLTQMLATYDAWITGIRRDQSPTRANTPVIDWDARYGLFKLCPFATWTEDMLWTYIHAYELPYNILHERGYASIGCYTCTRAATGRDGRWANTAKTECGIHFAPASEVGNASA